jgi:AraC-like DNA-binding protein
MIQNKSLHIKNMLCHCCIKLIKILFYNNRIDILTIRPGYVEIEFDDKKISLEEIDKILKDNGMEIIKSREEQIVEKIKQSVTELIHESGNINSILRKSDYLVEKLAMSYQQMSRIFSAHENITLERYIIKNKIEKIKEMIDSEEFSLSEIAYMMDYSSVQYLSNQFKKETGMTVSEYKKTNKKNKKSIDQLSDDTQK